MALKGKEVTVGTSATELTASGATGRRSVLVIVGGTDIWLHGSDDVLTNGTKGGKVAAGTALPLDVNAGERLYARVATGSSVCEVFEQGVG